MDEDQELIEIKREFMDIVKRIILRLGSVDEVKNKSDFLYETAELFDDFLFVKLKVLALGEKLEGEGEL